MTAPRRELLLDGLHLFAMNGFALAAPLLAKLGDNAEYFVSCRAEPGEILLLVLGVCLFPPLLMMGLEGLAARFASGRKPLHLAFVWLLTTVVVLQAERPYAPGNGLLAIGLALGIAAGFTIAYARFPSLRCFFTLLGALSLIIPISFFRTREIAALMASGGNQGYPAVKAGPPVVFIIFDELPSTSLMDDRHQIDARRYPNFAALARQATWYRNESTVADYTVNAVPAILTGRYPRPDRVPIAAEYPRNLFSMLGGAYDLQVYEGVTGLCPRPLNSLSEIAAEADRSSRSMASDLALVYLHLVVPADLAAKLPDISLTWSNFGTFAGARPDLDTDPARFMKRSDTFRNFVAAIHQGHRPALYFIHVVLPHVPWRFYPSGKAYADQDAPVLYGRGAYEKWIDDDAVIAGAWQRHLLQAGFVDRLLGELVARVKRMGIYDPSLLVVCSDHGVSFTPQAPRRLLNAQNYQDILPAVLLIKRPGQTRGAIDDRNVQTIDILPTVADVLGVKTRWPWDGRSLVDPQRRPRTRKVCYNRDGAPYFFAPDLGPAREVTLRRQLALFGSTPEGLYRFGPHGELVDGPAPASAPWASEVTCELLNPARYDNVDLAATYCPGWVRGRLHADGAGPLTVAVAVNGTIRGVTRSFVADSGELEFSIVISDGSFRNGRNRVELFLVTEGGLLRIRPRT